MAAALVQQRSQGNLPADVTSFVGRRREMADVRRMLSSCRLLTLVGVGGVGKTRLAVRAARELQRAFRDGVWMVELAALTEPALVPQAVADTFGLPQSGRGPLTVLTEYLEGRQLLLVLDNCEHLLDACAVLVARLIRGCPGLRILATSRQTLGVQGEQALPVPSLSVPGPDRIPPAESLVRYEAPSLLLARGAAVAPDFTATPANREAIVRLCQRLDGLPLAIELAAVRLRALTVEQILERLEDRFALLRGTRDAEPRQRTLGTLIDWSHGLCSPAEQLLWARLSVFARGFDLPAVEAVCTGDGIAADDVLDLVTGLVDKSILQVEESSGSMRYWMLETIREYGWDRLGLLSAQGDLRDRHRNYYRALAERSEQEWFGPQQVAWAASLGFDHANLRGALESCLLESTPEVGLGFASTLWFYWSCCGYLGEGRHWLEQLLAMDSSRTRYRAKALWAAGSLAVLQGDVPAALPLLAECEDLAGELDDQSSLAWAHQYAGLATLFMGDVSKAADLLGDAVRRHKAVGNQVGTALSLFLYGSTLSFAGEFDRSIAAAQECVEFATAHGEQWTRSYGQYQLGLAAWQQADAARTEELALSSVRLRRPFHDLLGLALSIDMAAWASAALGRAERAAVLLGAAQALWKPVGALEFGFTDMVGWNDQSHKRAREDLGDKAFDAAFAKGMQLSNDEVIGYALSMDVETAHPAAAHEPQRLTHREAQIAGLVARGLTNRQIAETLVISQRTAESHIDHILTKLAFTSRSQIAAWAVEHVSAPGDG
jgi:predicted ATPase/DNA-binding CsgD family transcriptional regulator